MSAYSDGALIYTALQGEAIERGTSGKNKVRFVVRQVNGWRGVACHVLMSAFLVVVLGSWIVGMRGMRGPGNLCNVSQTLLSALPPHDPSSLLVMANALSRVGVTGSTSPNARHVPTKFCPPTIYPLNTHNPSPTAGCECWCAGIRTSATSPSHSRTRP